MEITRRNFFKIVGISVIASNIPNTAYSIQPKILEQAKHYNGASIAFFDNCNRVLKQYGPPLATSNFLLYDQIDWTKKPVYYMYDDWKADINHISDNFKLFIISLDETG